jgi:uncharacterized protein (DUF1330 family)
MAVYVVNNMTIHDRAAYGEYVKGFVPLLPKFGGEVVALQDAPKALEGEWPFDRSVILRFPDRDTMRRFVESPEYQAIVGHRHRGTRSNLVALDGFTPPA